MEHIKSYLLAAASLLVVTSCSHGKAISKHATVDTTQILAASMAASVSEYWGPLENCGSTRSISVIIAGEPSKATSISLNQIHDKGNISTFWRARKRASVEMADTEFRGTPSSIFTIRSYEVTVDNEVFESIRSKLSILDILNAGSDRNGSQRPQLDGPFFGSRINLCDQSGFVVRTTNAGFQAATGDDFRPFIAAAQEAIPELRD